MSMVMQMSQKLEKLEAKVAELDAKLARADKQAAVIAKREIDAYNKRRLAAQAAAKAKTPAKMTRAQADAAYCKIEDPVARAEFRRIHADELGLHTKGRAMI